MKIDFDVVDRISLELKKVVLNESEQEARIALDRLIFFMRNPKDWACQKDLDK